MNTSQFNTQIAVIENQLQQIIRLFLEAHEAYTKDYNLEDHAKYCIKKVEQSHKTILNAYNQITQSKEFSEVMILFRQVLNEIEKIKNELYTTLENKTYSESFFIYFSRRFENCAYSFQEIFNK